MTTITSNNEIDSTLEWYNMESIGLETNFEELYNHIGSLNLEKEEPLISIILPMYNEEKTIKTVLEALPRSKTIEIIVVDDNSTDDSLSEIAKLKSIVNIKILKHKKNKGYGGACLTGIKHSKGRIIVTMDSDGQHRPEDIYSIVKPILDGVADITIGSRYLGACCYDLPTTTRLGEAIVEKLIYILFGQRVKNNQNGFRGFNRKMLHILDDIKYQGYAFATELILKAAMYDYKIKECPIHVYDRKFGSSKINLRKLTLNLFACIFRYYLKKIKMNILRNENKI